MNPYFLQYDIKPDQVGEFVVKAGGFIVCHFADSAEFSKGVYRTKFGQFIKDTDYANYAVSSEFSDNHTALLESKPSSAYYFCTIETQPGLFSVWIERARNIYYIQKKRQIPPIPQNSVPEW